MKVGVNSWGKSTAQWGILHPLLQEAGITHTRMGYIIESNKISRSAEVDWLLARGVEVIGTLGEPQPYGNILDDLAGWGDYVYNMVTYFRHRIGAWVVLNEPNLQQFGGYSPAEYALILKEAYTRAKQAAPEVIIITGNFNWVHRAVPYLQSLYAEGIQGYFDALGIDPYCMPASPLEPNTGYQGSAFWTIPQLKAVMEANGDPNKNIWIIEFGYQSLPCATSTANSISEALQAQYIFEALTLAESWGYIERFYVYRLDDSPGQVCIGILTQFFTRKPAFYSVKNFIAGQPTHVQLNYSSTPIPVSASVDGLTLESGDIASLPEGSIVTLTVPEKVVT